MAGKHVIFGATGGLGSAVARVLSETGAETVAAVREAGKARNILPQGVEIRKCNVLDPRSVRDAAEGADIIHYDVNFPYSEWEKNSLDALNNIINAGADSHSRIVFPGNIYGYGRLRARAADESHPMAAETVKGKIRNRMEETLIKAYGEDRIGLVIPRFADFYGPNVTNELYGQIFRSAIAERKSIWVGRTDVPHDFLYIEDAARAAVLLSRRNGAGGQVWHVSGPGAITASEFFGMMSLELGRNLEARKLGRTALRFYGIFTPPVREVIELLYLYEEPEILDDSKFRNEFPDFVYTEHREAIRRTLDWFRHNRGR